jgi:CheY-like chemotaxis protein
MRQGRWVTHRILIVEDNPADIHLLRLALTEAGIQADLTVFDDGAAAVNWLEHHCRAEENPRPHLAIIDLNIPKRGGLEILSTMRECEAFAAVPAIVLTSSLSERDRESTLHYTLARFLIKPSNLDDFLKIGAEVRSALDAAVPPAAG